MISRYKIISRLGSGGMGEVFVAEDTTLRRRVALKFLAPTLSSDPILRQRFLREAQSAAALNHPNIITIFEVAEHGERVFIAMEYVEGRTLREIIDLGQITPQDAIALAVQICDGLQAAHKAGYVHRDIKPLNIIVDPSNRVRILDFGLAKAVGDVQLTQAGSALGTVQYMSPEQGQGAELDHRSDIFAVGIVLYEMLSRKLPFQKNNMAATIYAIITEPHPPLPPHVIARFPNIQTILDRALAKPVDQRYQSISDMGAELRQLLGGEHTQTTMAGLAVQTMVPPTPPKPKSLAVLHLRNMGSPDDDFLSYGITEDLIVDLTRVGTIRVAPMRSIMRFKDSDADVNEIATKLNVAYVLDGSIHKSAGGLRISAELINVEDGANLWAERWQEPLENLPRIKRLLLSAVTQALDIGQTIIRVAEVGKAVAEDAGAYELYLRGKYAFDKKKDKADVESALSLYRKALAMEPSLLAARVGIAEILLYQGLFADARVEIDLGLTEAEAKNLHSEQAHLLRLMAKFHVQHAQWDAARASADHALTLSRKLGDLSGEAESLGILISIFQQQARFDDTLPLFDRVLEISRKLDDRDKAAEALKNMGVAYSRKGDYGRALDLYEEALELARQVENLSLQAACLSNIGNVSYFKGDLDNALRNYGEALAINNRLGDQGGTARQSLNMGLVHLQRGQNREGLELLNTAATFFEALGDKVNFSMTLSNISHLSLTLGEIDKSRNAADRALAIAEENNHPLSLSTAHHRLGAISLHVMDYDNASLHLHRAMEIAEGAKMSRNVATLQVNLAELHYHRRQFDFSRKHAERAQTISREIGDKVTLILAEAYLATAAAAEGLFHAGTKQLRQVLGKAKEIGDANVARQIEILLGEVLYTRGRGADQNEGKAILQHALIQATSDEISPEISRISRVLDAPPDQPA